MINNYIETYDVIGETAEGVTEGMKLVKEYDEFAENPRNFNDGGSRFYTFERRRGSPDNHEFTSMTNWADSLHLDTMHGIYGIIQGLRRKGYLALPVYRYEHSGVVYRASEQNPFNDRWDSCLIGVIYISKADARKRLGVKKLTKDMEEFMYKQLIAEVDVYSSWADGDVYCYTLYDSAEEVVETMDSIYGDDIVSLDDVLDAFNVSLAAYA